LPEYGGEEIKGRRLYEQIVDAFFAGKIEGSAVCIHFATEGYNKGPVFFRYPIHLTSFDDWKTLRAKTVPIMNSWQIFIANLLFTGQIRWDGNPDHKIIVPDWYREYSFCPEELK